eukprot:TRINITY_DN1341_c0_g1_i2.p1 TRINITY_DN1341_c0_g1~~TRINITY_DN1341_c0_g1_i2.p1  ORF type:complete len:578 (-),score=107.69 TRINITY_DN1341_c0_g1_i2:210-1943(-)
MSREAARYSDKDFPAENSSVFVDPLKPKDFLKITEWRRLYELCTLSPSSSSKSKITDLALGQANDVGFVSALAAVAARTQLFQTNIEPNVLNPKGRYFVKFYKNCQWVEICVDDFIPCRNGSPAFSHARIIGDWWILIIEKAYAKVHRSYEALIGGDLVEYSLTDLTGGVTTRKSFKDPIFREKIKSGQLWEKLLRYIGSGYVVTCSTDGRDEIKDLNGILPNYSYSINDLRETSKGLRLMKINNPFQASQWTGNFSFGSRDWTPEIKREVDYQEGEKNVFWITFEDFVVYFNSACFCAMPSLSYKYYRTIETEWSEQFSGGSSPVRLCVNPQFSLEVLEETTLFITVSLPDKRMEGKANIYDDIGFIVLSALSPSRLPSYQQADVVQGPFMIANRREISKKITLPVGQYIVIAFTKVAKVVSPFTLRVDSEKDVDMCLLSDLKITPSRPSLTTLSQTHKAPILTSTEKSRSFADPSLTPFTSDLPLHTRAITAIPGYTGHRGLGAVHAHATLGNDFDHLMYHTSAKVVGGVQSSPVLDAPRAPLKQTFSKSVGGKSRSFSLNTSLKKHGVNDKLAR